MTLDNNTFVLLDDELFPAAMMTAEAIEQIADEWEYFELLLSESDIEEEN